MKSITQIKIFISTTREIREEVDSIKLIVEEINKTSGRQSGFTIESLKWDLDTYTQVGDDAQEVINKQLGNQYDILVAILWQRIGTPTKRDKSGTIEEINCAITNKKELLVYFKTTTPESLNLIDLDELAKINAFKKNISEKGVLYKEFSTIETFESLFRISLVNLIHDKLINKDGIKNLPEKIELNSEYGEYRTISDLIAEVESKSDDSLLNLDFFKMVEELLSHLGIVTSSTNSITIIINNLTAKLNEKTIELNKLDQIEDQKLKMMKVQIVVDLLAGELDEFNSRMNKELQSFSKSFLLVGPTYSSINSIASNYDLEDIKVMQQSVISFRASIAVATNTSAGLLRIVMGWPPMTPRFNKSKRATELTLKDLTKEMLNGLKLLDEAIGVDSPK